MTSNNAVQDVTYLASCAVNNQTPDHGRVDSMDSHEVYILANNHMATTTVTLAPASDQ